MQALAELNLRRNKIVTVVSYIKTWPNMHVSQGIQKPFLPKCDFGAETIFASLPAFRKHD
jgi:hypothetical protein